MLKEIIKKVTKQRGNETKLQYIKRVKCAENNIRNGIDNITEGIEWVTVNTVKGIIKVLPCVAASLLLAALIVLWLTQDEGHYEPEYMDENGIMYDIDGDGELWDWVQE